MALALTVGGVRDLDTAKTSLARLRGRLDHVAEIVLQIDDSKRLWDHLRYVAELQRDIVGRARAMRSRPEANVLSEGLGAAVIGAVAPASGVLAVVEWIQTPENRVSFVTAIDSTGMVNSRFLTMPNIDYEELGEVLSARLTGWHSHRVGDPLDLPEWQSVVKELNRQLCSHVGSDAHIVFIEPLGIPPLPWHTAVAEQYSTSYSAGWGHILSFQQAGVHYSSPVLGLAVVPRHGESDIVLQALDRSAVRTGAFLEDQGLEVVSCTGVACDRHALRDLFEGTDVLKLLCHGFVDADGEVALMAAANGALPLADSVAAGTPVGMRHRITWRELQDLKRSPGVVFSAACSSGQARLAETGDRLGFAGGLRLTGTQAVVAPRWDIPPTDVVPILDDALELYLTTKEGLGRCLQWACLKAASSHPQWLSWSLTLEGDWR